MKHFGDISEPGSVKSHVPLTLEQARNLATGFRKLFAPVEDDDLQVVLAALKRVAG